MLVNQRVEVKKNGAQPIKHPTAHHWEAAHAKLVVMDRRRPPKEKKKTLETWKLCGKKSLPRPSWKYHSWHLFGGFYMVFTMDFWKENHGSFLLPDLLGFDWLKSRMKSPFWGMALATIGDPGLNHCTTISNRMLRRCTVFGTIQNPQPSWRHKISKSMSKEIIQLRSVEWLKLHSPAGSRIFGGTLSQGSGDWKDQTLGLCAADLEFWNGISWKDHEKHCRKFLDISSFHHLHFLDPWKDHFIICISCFFS